MKLLIRVYFRSALFILILFLSSDLLSINKNKSISFYSESGIFSDSSGSNDGTDPSKPLSRIDIQNDFYWDWLEYKNDRFYNISQINAGKTFYKGHLYFYLRIPVVSTNVNFESQTGYGDISFDIQYSTYNKYDLNFIGGSKFIFPTASLNQTGFGKYIAGPYAGFIEYFNAGFYGLILTDYFSYAGQFNRNDINELSINPLFKINLGKNWYTIITPDIIYTFKTGKFFIPYTQEFGKMFNEEFTASLKAGFHLKNDNKYDVLAEIKLSYLYN